MRIASLFSLFMISVGMAYAAGPQKYEAGIAILKAQSEVSVYQDEASGQLRYVTGQLSDPVAPGGEMAAVVRFLTDHQTAYAMKNPAEEIKVTRVDRDELGMQHIRMGQTYQGMPVYGSELIAHFSPEGILKALNGTYVDDISVNPTPLRSVDQARNAAMSDLASFFGTGQPSEPELLVFPWEGKNYLAYRVEIFSSVPMGRWEYFVDAKTGEIIFKANRIMDTDAIGTGIGVTGATRTHIDTDYNGSLYSLIDNARRAANNPHGHNGQMLPGGAIKTYVSSVSLPGTIATDPDNNWNAASQASSVDGHFLTAQVYDWLLSAFGRNSFDNLGASMTVSVDYSAEGTNNAYWNGSQIVIWKWATSYRSLAGCPDVIAHEWAHAVTEHTSGLIYQKESGALNESFSDMMGARLNGHIMVTGKPRIG